MDPKICLIGLMGDAKKKLRPYDDPIKFYGLTKLIF